MPKREPLYPHVPRSKQPLFPHHAPKPQEHEGWVYVKVGTTEVRGRKVPDGMNIEQVSPTFNRDDFDKAVRIIEERLKGQQLTQTKYGPPETADPEVKELWRIALKETEAKYPIGHPDLVNDAKRAGVSQEETQKMIAHEIYLERRRVLIEKWAREHGLEKELKARDKEEEEESPSLLPYVLIEGGEPIPPQYRHLTGWIDKPLPREAN